MSLIPSSLQMAPLIDGASFLPSTQTAALTLVRPRPSDARCARLSASETDYYFPIHRGKQWSPDSTKHQSVVETLASVVVSWWWRTKAWMF